MHRLRPSLNRPYAIAVVATVLGLAGPLAIAFPAGADQSAAEGEFTNLSETKDRGADFEHPAVWSSGGSPIAYPERYHSNAPPSAPSTATARRGATRRACRRAPGPES